MNDRSLYTKIWIGTKSGLIRKREDDRAYFNYCVNVPVSPLAL